MLTCLAIGLCPTLNTYIPSLTRGTPFKISLHSWSKPVLWSPKLVRGHEVVIAMHVAIDGKTVASVSLSSKTINFDTNMCTAFRRSTPMAAFLTRSSTRQSPAQSSLHFTKPYSASSSFTSPTTWVALRSVCPKATSTRPMARTLTLSTT
jgi:hypothetical protein